MTQSQRKSDNGGTHRWACQNEASCGVDGRSAMANTNPNFFYEDEDLILPMLLHPSSAQGIACACRDCIGIRQRIEQIQHLQGSRLQAS